LTTEIYDLGVSDKSVLINKYVVYTVA